MGRGLGALLLLSLAGPAVAQPKKAAPPKGAGKAPKKGEKPKPPEEPPPPPPEEPKAPEPAPPPPKEPEPAPSPPPPPPAVEESPEFARARLTAGVSLLRRTFAFQDILSPGLQGYKLSAGFAFEVSGAVFPLSNPKPGWEIGLVGSYGRSLGLTSQAPDGTSLTTTYERWNAGLRTERRGAEGAKLALIGADVTYGNTRFSFDGDTPGAKLPDASYGSAVLGVDGKVALGPLSVGLRLNGGILPKLGPLKDNFPHVSGGVVGGNAWIGVPISRRVEARVGAELQRFFFSFNPEPGDTFVAGGAVDQFLRGGIDVLFRI